MKHINWENLIKKEWDILRLRKNDMIKNTPLSKYNHCYNFFFNKFAFKCSIQDFVMLRAENFQF